MPTLARTAFSTLWRERIMSVKCVLCGTRFIPTLHVKTRRCTSCRRKSEGLQPYCGNQGATKVESIAAHKAKKASR
jgi:uncharacterized OB-fold protein